MLITHAQNAEIKTKTLKRKNGQENLQNDK